MKRHKPKYEKQFDWFVLVVVFLMCLIYFSNLDARENLCKYQNGRVKTCWHKKPVIIRPVRATLLCFESVAAISNGSMAIGTAMYCVRRPINKQEDFR